MDIEQDVKRIDEYIYQCSNSPIWVETICMKNRCSKELLLYALSQFKLHAVATGEKYYAPKDFMGHFTNWLTINISKLSLPKKAQPKPQDKPVVADGEAIMQKACIDALNHVKGGNFYNDPGNSCYSYLERNGYIKYTAAEKNAFIDEAKGKAKDRYGKPVNYEEARSFKRIISELETKNTPEVIVLAKKIAVNNFLKKMIAEGLQFKFS